MRILISAPSLATIAEFSSEAVGERVQFLTPSAKDEWVLKRPDGSIIDGIVVRQTAYWAFHMEAAA